MKLVIVGGGFCGALVAKKLENKKNIELTLIDKKDFFEYTPSIHKIIYNPEYQKKIEIPYVEFLKNSNIITENVLQVGINFIKTKEKKIHFDYLVISTGIDYPIFLKNKKNVITLKSSLDALSIGELVSKSKHVLIIGGGLIGTEIAGELVTKFRNLKLTIVHSPKRLIERNPVKASRYAKKFLEKRGAEIIFDEKVVAHKDGNFITNKERIINADMGIWCAGIKYNPKYMKDFSDSIFTKIDALKVNNYLQLEGYPHIFVGGDITSIKEEKTAQNAELHANTIAENLKRVMENKPLKFYKSKKILLLISLGDWSGIMTFRKFTFTGFIPGILKKMVEWWILGRYSTRWGGI